MNNSYIHDNWKDEVSLQRALVGPFVSGPDLPSSISTEILTRPQLQLKVDKLEKELRAAKKENQELRKKSGSISIRNDVGNQQVFEVGDEDSDELTIAEARRAKKKKIALKNTNISKEKSSSKEKSKPKSTNKIKIRKATKTVNTRTRTKLRRSVRVNK